MSTKFTDEQSRALRDFDEAVTSQDLRAFGDGRKHRAHVAVVSTFEAIKALGIADALTVSELAQVNQSSLYVARS